MKPSYELLIIGAGPAGMSAACEAASRGVEVCVIDDQPVAGGQIYRNVTAASDKQKKVLGPDYQAGNKLVKKFLTYGGEYFSGASVWHIDGTNQVGVIHNDNTYFVEPKNLVIATGAQERPMPIPGWQLPGVLYAGAGQILLKASGLAPSGGMILAGSGPLLLLLASQYIKAGVDIKAILDTTPQGRVMQHLGKLFKGWKGYDYLIKGVGLLKQIKAAGIPYYKHVKGLQVQGVDKLKSVTFGSASLGLRQVSNVTLDSEHLLLHQGIIPNTRLAEAAECELVWNHQQACWNVNTDDTGLCRNNTYVIGDGASIKGAVASQIQGQLCGLHVATMLGKVEQSSWQQRSTSLIKSMQKHLTIRPFLDCVYSPTEEYLTPTNAGAIVCRCEEVTVDDIHQAQRH
jgi:NADPH-dependent 2,4-dienoyl-CoA reductase/sulfur reductase-like enzyme